MRLSGTSGLASNPGNRGIDSSSGRLSTKTFFFLDFFSIFFQCRSDGAPEPDGVIKVVVRKKILHYFQLYIDRSEPIDFIPVAVDTSDRIYDDFLRLLFLHAHREASSLANDIPEESGHFRFLRAACLARHEDFHTA